MTQTAMLEPKRTPHDRQGQAMTRNSGTDVIVSRLRDHRSGRVVFLSHCLLNENTRYLGGACRQGCVREIVEQCLELGVGMVQMPCPEQAAWGGVLERHMLRLYGAARSTTVARIGALAVPMVVAYTRIRYRRLAARVAVQVADYVRSGFSVVAVVAVDGSPSCGLDTTMDVAGSLLALASFDPSRVTVEAQNTLVRQHATKGRGIFVEELRRALSRRGLAVPFLAHDLFDELDGRGARLQISRETATTCS